MLAARLGAWLRKTGERWAKAAFSEKLAVALAYYYYLSLFKKIKKTSPEKILSMRVRISNFIKYLIIIRVSILYKLKFI